MRIFTILLLVVFVQLPVQANNLYNNHFTTAINAAMTQFVSANDEGEITLTIRYKKPKTLNNNGFGYQDYRLMTEQQLYYSQQWYFQPAYR